MKIYSISISITSTICLMSILFSGITNASGGVTQHSTACNGDQDCQTEEVCIKRICETKCDTPCGAYAKCYSKYGVELCECSVGFVRGYEHRLCAQSNTICNVDQDCGTEEVCINRTCESKCREMCGDHGKCYLKNNHQMCDCFPGFKRDDDRNLCVKSNTTPACNVDEDCQTEEVCIKRICERRCDAPCGANAKCYSKNGLELCECFAGFERDYGRNLCVKSNTTCNVDQDCRTEEVCIKRICERRCDAPCGAHAKCYSKNGLELCECFAGFERDYGRNLCVKSNTTPACNVDEDCQTKEVCIKRICERRCHAPCGANAKCYLKKSFALCECFAGFERDYGRRLCVKSNTICNVDQDCGTEEVCIKRTCESKCRDMCGDHGKCYLKNNLETCDCFPGFKHHYDRDLCVKSTNVTEENKLSYEV